MAKRTLNDLQKQYNSYAAATQSSPMRGPGGPGRPGGPGAHGRTGGSNPRAMQKK